MKLGLVLTGVRTADLAPLARAAEDAGFDSVWVPSSFGNYVGASVLAQATGRITVGSAIVPAFHASPLHHATAALTLDELTGGRFVLGLGTQTKGMIRAELGQELDRPLASGRELIQLVRQLMANGGKAVAYAGQYYRIQLPGTRPVRRTGVRGEIPIYLAAVNPGSWRMAAELCDGLVGHPIYTTHYLDTVVVPNREVGFARGGRRRADFTLVAEAMVWIDSDHAEAYRRARANIAFYLSTRAYTSFAELHGWGAERAAIRRALEQD